MFNRIRVSSILGRLILIIWTVGIILPMIWVLYESLKTNREFFADIWALPVRLNFKNYLIAWNELELGKAFFNTVYFIVVTMAVSISITTLSAYALTRMVWKGRKFAWWFLMLSLLLPGINAIIPQYLIARALHLTGSLSGFIIINIFSIDIFSLMVIGGFMQTIPKELEESAYIDGASLMQLIRKVIVPLSVPGIVTVSIFKFLAYYNDFLGPYIYLSDNPEKYTIGVSMYLANQKMIYKSNWVVLFAAVVIAMIPGIIIYLMFQRTVTQGATLGAIKG